MKKGIFLLLGSNLGDRESYLKKAREEIVATIGSVVRISSIYKTIAWGVENQPDFLNQVVQVNTQLNPNDLLVQALAVEERIGRIRELKWESRVIDIDLLFYDQQIISLDHLKIPHPHIPQRRFTLEPLAEIAPAFIHPILKVSIMALLRRCEDTSTVEKTGL